MAGEFFVMERLFRRGDEPALTLGNAKSIDIIVRTQKGALKTISVKSARGGGKWGVESDDLSGEKNLLFVFLLYKSFDDLTTSPQVWVMKAADVEQRKKPWFNKSAIYYGGKCMPPDMNEFKDAWDLIDL
jgi:hypothetical protein